MRALEALAPWDGGGLPAGLEGPRAGGWGIETGHEFTQSRDVGELVALLQFMQD